MPALSTLADGLRQVHLAAIDELLSPERERQSVLAEINEFVERFLALCEAVSVLGELTPRALDAVAGMGEQMSVRILAAYLREVGLRAEAIDATELIVTDDHFQAATPLFEATNRRTADRLEPLLAAGTIPVVTGFIAATANGITTTLGRGGSDFTAAILGQALPADEVWIWTDVDGVMTADPRMVSRGSDHCRIDQPRSVRTGLLRSESAPSKDDSTGGGASTFRCGLRTPLTRNMPAQSLSPIIPMAAGRSKR